MNQFNKSKIKFFEDHSLLRLEEQVNAFMATTVKIYNVKHIIETTEEDATIHYIMVSYE